MANLSIFDPAFNEPFEPMFRRFLAPLRAEMDNNMLQIRVDVEEKDKSYTVRADMPGVKKEDINVRIDGNIVQIDAETKQEKEVKEKGKLLRSERYYGSISRTFSLTQDVDEAKAVAKYENGVLNLELPKKETTASKRLTVQ
ncbi:MAG: Hsp20/alpha crystallin family protein [Burkholderiaceae bacterium]|nr:Hsp20/alpha crystallin family protein [Burkholderiaceae bacterium]